MAEKLTDKLVKTAATPDKGFRLIWDTDVRGFGIRITAAGARSFILNYRRKSDGLERRWTIGGFPDWGTAAAREQAARLKRAIDGGADPVGDHEKDRGSPTVADMCDRFAKEYFPHLRASSAGDYETAIRLHIRPALGRQKVCALTYGDIAALHRRISVTATYQANRTIAVLSRMLNLAIKRGWRSDNPARGIQRNQEEKRHRYLTADELVRLTKALTQHPDQQAANIFRLLLLTGARRGEVQAMRWADLDWTAGVWTKPASLTKQRALHRVPLSAPARQLLAELEAERDGAEFVFGGRFGGHRVRAEGRLGGALQIRAHQQPSDPRSTPQLRKPACGRRVLAAGHRRTARAQHADDNSSLRTLGG